ncbi:MAG TPA: hypothetical protein VGK67_22425 [Myxococcales bacterium]|jgi:hypothetical protein
MKSALSMAVVAVVLLGSACARAGGKTDGLFTVESKGPGKVATGEKGTAEIQIKVKPDGHISDEAPLKAKVAGKNVQPSKEKLSKSDATYKDGGATLAVPFTATEKGAGSLDADLSFYMCSKEICEKQERKVSIPVTVQ